MRCPKQAENGHNHYILQDTLADRPVRDIRQHTLLINCPSYRNNYQKLDYSILYKWSMSVIQPKSSRGMNTANLSQYFIVRITSHKFCMWYFIWWSSPGSRSFPGGNVSHIPCVSRKYPACFRTYSEYLIYCLDEPTDVKTSWCSNITGDSQLFFPSPLDLFKVCNFRDLSHKMLRNLGSNWDIIRHCNPRPRNDIL